jgi:hypothetical protein
VSECLGSKEVVLKLQSSSNELVVTGTRTREHTMERIEMNVTGVVEVRGKAQAGYEVIAEDRTIGRFARIDVNALIGENCHYTGMVIPPA